MDPGYPGGILIFGFIVPGVYVSRSRLELFEFWSNSGLLPAGCDHEKAQGSSTYMPLGAT